MSRESIDDRHALILGNAGDDQGGEILGQPPPQTLRVYLVLHYDFLQVPNYRVEEGQLVDAV